MITGVAVSLMQARTGTNTKVSDALTDDAKTVLDQSQQFTFSLSPQLAYDGPRIPESLKYNEVFHYYTVPGKFQIKDQALRQGTSEGTLQGH